MSAAEATGRGLVRPQMSSVYSATCWKRLSSTPTSLSLRGIPSPAMKASGAAEALASSSTFYRERARLTACIMLGVPRPGHKGDITQGISVRDIAGVPPQNMANCVSLRPSERRR